jgi:hypothetical protein
MQKQLIRVVYPTDGERIALRTEENWNSNIEAHSVGQNGSLWEFWIRTERPYFYFKPVLVSDSSVQWSRGKNFLAVATSGAPLEIYPYFREDTRCSVCELMPPLTGPSGAQHRFRVFLPPGYHENTPLRVTELGNCLNHIAAIGEELEIFVFVNDRWIAEFSVIKLGRAGSCDFEVGLGEVRSHTTSAPSIRNRDWLRQERVVFERIRSDYG